MKLALAIILCSGLYLCAVSAMYGDASASQPLLVHDASPSKPSKVSKSRKKFLSENGHKMFLETIYEKCTARDNLRYDTSALPRWVDRPVKYEDFVEFVNNKCGLVFKNDDEKFEQFVIFSENRLMWPSQNLPKYNIRYNLIEGSFKHLDSAEPNFKEKCIEKFESELAKSLGEFVRYNDTIVTPHAIEMEKVAFATLEDQLKIFVDDLKKSGIKLDAQQSLDNCLKHRDILRIFGFWFAPNCNKNDLQKAIREMREEHHLNNDKAAKVMVLLKKFGGEQVDEKYLPVCRSYWQKLGFSPSARRNK